jgi:hypothetical protein
MVGTKAESTVVDEIRAAGSDSPLAYVFVKNSETRITLRDY